jgi:TRAP-type C4-dicarboxylate transport system permease small subunit
VKALLLRLDRLTTGVSLAVACLMLSIASCLGLFQILTRFVFEQPAEWTEVMIRFSLIWMVFMGIPTAFRTGAMVSVDVLYRLSGEKMKRVLDYFVCGAALILISVIIWWGADYAWRGRVQSISGLEDYSMLWAYIAMPIGGVFSAIGILANLFDPQRLELETAQ